MTDAGGGNNEVLQYRYMTLDGAATMRYQNRGVFDPARGDFAIGIFTATATTQTITLQSGHDNNPDKRAVQLNGMQVRDLGPATDSACNVWAGGASGAWGDDATNWNDLSGTAREGTLWDAANGATNTALFGSAATALPSGDLTVGGIAANATLTLADGTTPVLCRLAGEGTLVFDGTVTLTNESTQAFTGTLDGDVIVRKAGFGDWTLGGTHTGALALDAQEGTTILATDGAVVSIADGAKVNLAGASRSLGTVSGQGTITKGTLSAALVIADGSDITLGAVTHSAGVTLNGVSSVTFAEDKNLAGLSVYVADPAAARASRKTVVAVEGEMTGEPTFTFGMGGYKAKLAADGKGYVVGSTGFMIIVR